ncbi:MAG: RNA polymerase factor sigma-54 [Phycisphaerales bacterium]|nr:RNA polymerase factor sigma-54 [Phycisphaerales bacterium]
MRFETQQSMKLGQQMKLAPRMIQSMEILQMPLAELQERIQQELESNPTLELAEASAAAAEVESEVEDADPAESNEDEDDVTEGALSEDETPLDVGDDRDDFARLEQFNESNPEAAENEFDGGDESHEAEAPSVRELAERPSRDEDFEYSPRASGDDRDAKSEAMAATPARSISLHEQLREQWHLAEVKEELKPLGELIISFLDADGYLRTPLETIADRAPVTGAGETKPRSVDLENALRAVQLFLEPPGVAARDARECLLLQLDAFGDAEDERKIEPEVIAHARLIVENHLDDLMNNRLPRVSEKTHLSLAEIRGALELLKKLSLAPARRLVSEDVRPIVADAIVEYDAEKDRYIAYLNERRIPDLRINQEYAQLSKGKPDKGMDKRGKDFLRTNLSNAAWLIDAVNQRKHTLLRVVQAVVDAQRDYFDFGPQALKPLPMTLVAEQLGIHVATVSRAVSEKHLQTPRGVVPLRKFFSGGLQTDAGEDMAWDAIKVALRDIIDHEDKKKPWSDEALVDKLQERGIEIARRTVAKYRDQLNIPAARLRREY